MKVGIIGFPQTGKKTLFKLLTDSEMPEVRQDQQKSIPGIAAIRDTRLDSLTNIYMPKKRTPAQIELELLPDLDKRLIQEGKIFGDIANLDAICHIVRTFKDESIYHVKGSVDMERDIDEINGEFILHDLLFIEKRKERIAKNVKKGIAQKQKEEGDLLIKFQKHLEKNLPLRTLSLSESENEIISGYPFLTIKELIIVINTDEHNLTNNEIKNSLHTKYDLPRENILLISAKIEEEIRCFDSEEERMEFMLESGIKEPAINQLTQTCMRILGLISYFTVGKDEVRQWLVNKDSFAPQAARVIHSDIERGFIRAEVMKYDDHMEYGTEEKIKQAGKYYIMGKDYKIEDGDIVGFRFNV